MAKPEPALRRVDSVESYVVSLNRIVDVADDPLEILFRLHYGRLVRTLTLVAGDREIAADAVQEAFVKAHLNWWRIKRYDDPIGWIRHVAVNRLRDVHRRTVRERRAVDRLIVEAASGSMPSVRVDDAMAAEESHDAELLDLVAALPRQQRLAVTMFYVSELSIAEVARAMGLNEGTVKFHLHQGRSRLRDLLPDSDRWQR